jgi:hypothetical protein
MSQVAKVAMIRILEFTSDKLNIHTKSIFNYSGFPINCLNRTEQQVVKLKDDCLGEKINK